MFNQRLIHVLCVVSKNYARHIFLNAISALLKKLIIARNMLYTERIRNICYRRNDCEKGFDIFNKL